MTDKDVDVNVNYDFYNDVNKGTDPDKRSKTLRKYHAVLWSRGKLAEINKKTLKIKLTPNDSIIFAPDNFLALYRGTDKNYRNTRTPEIIKEQNRKTNNGQMLYPKHEYTIAASLIFPKFKQEKGGRQTINQARGIKPKIADRIDLTLECIRRYYKKEFNPLDQCFKQPENVAFFSLFKDFEEYINFFLLQDFMTNDCNAVKDLFSKDYKQEIPENIFENKNNYPHNTDEWKNLYFNLTRAVKQRTERIKDLLNNNLTDKN